MRFTAACLALLALVGCAKAPQPAHPALWQVDGPQGQRGWLFGTIHALPQQVTWRSAAIDKALAGSDRLVLEVAALENDGATAETFARLAHTPGLPPLSQRIDPALRPALRQLLDKAGIAESRFTDVETWAAAVTLAQALQGDSDSGNGIDRAILRATRGKPVAELEGADVQLGMFDTLTQGDQRDLLGVVVTGADDAAAETARLETAWRKGDMAAIEAATHTGLLADPELRQVLFLRRNHTWTAKLDAMLHTGAHPFVAVGAAHMAGPDGLPALLSAKGYSVTRLQ
jgi:uncharacterized protein YbaP (TraB family)